MSTEARSTLVPASVETSPDSPVARPPASRTALPASDAATPVFAHDFVAHGVGHGVGAAADGLAARSLMAAAVAAPIAASAAAPAGRPATLPVTAQDGMALHEGPHRDEIIKRLRRAEGQLRGIVRMLEEGQGCMAVAQQLTAVRKALDAAMTRMAVGYLEQELGGRAQADPAIPPAVEHVGRLISRIT